jgi:hypothetical protein
LVDSGGFGMVAYAITTPNGKITTFVSTTTKSCISL